MVCNNLMVLYSGGTIGMQMTAEGLAPASGLEALLRARQAEQHDGLPHWRFRELQPLLDSANMTQANWLALADAVRQAVDEDGCDGVLLLHGTDTLAYSAAALSFLLLGLPVPLLLTGAMLPVSSSGSDAWGNLFGALRRLQAGIAPGVYLYFHDRLLHGARASKLSSDAFDAFAELPRLRQGAHASAWPASLSYRQPRQPVRLAVLPLHPGFDASLLRALLENGVRGVVLECYGSGTGPADDPLLLEVLREAHARGVVLLAISQCLHGHIDFAVYAAGSQLAACGLLSGVGMTREAALGKLFALLGAGLGQADVEHWLSLDLCGERRDDTAS